MHFRRKPGLLTDPKNSFQTSGLSGGWSFCHLHSRCALLVCPRFSINTAKNRNKEIPSFRQRPLLLLVSLFESLVPFLKQFFLNAGVKLGFLPVSISFFPFVLLSRLNFSFYLKLRVKEGLKLELHSAFCSEMKKLGGDRTVTSKCFWDQQRFLMLSKQAFGIPSSSCILNFSKLLLKLQLKTETLQQRLSAQNNLKKFECFKRWESRIHLEKGFTGEILQASLGSNENLRRSQSFGVALCDSYAVDAAFEQIWSYIDTAERAESMCFAQEASSVQFFRQLFIPMHGRLHSKYPEEPETTRVEDVCSSLGSKKYFFKLCKTDDSVIDAFLGMGISITTFLSLPWRNWSLIENQWNTDWAESVSDLMSALKFQKIFYRVQKINHSSIHGSFFKKTVEKAWTFREKKKQFL